MDAPNATKTVDLAMLRARLDDLGRRRVIALAHPRTALDATERRKLEAMRFELAEAEWHLAQLESS